MQELSCTLGLRCSINLTGYRMEPTNAIVAISSGDCGDADAVVANETWGIEYANRTHGNGSNASYALGTPLVGVAGAFYRLCWGHDPAVLADFNVEIDASAELAGPGMQFLLRLIVYSV